MEIQRDFKELLELLNANGVEYLIVGAFALGHHGAPRATGDLDIFIRPEIGNAQRTMAALEQFGFGSVGLTPKDFEDPDHVVQLGFPPVRIDLITSLTSVSWEEAYAGRSQGFFDNVPVFYLGKNEFIKNKRSTGRPKDVADAEALERKPI